MGTLEEFVLFHFLNGVLTRAKFCCKHGFAFLILKSRERGHMEKNQDVFKIAFCNLRPVWNSCLTTQQGREIVMLRVFLGQKMQNVS